MDTTKPYNPLITKNDYTGFTTKSTPVHDADDAQLSLAMKNEAMQNYKAAHDTYRTLAEKGNGEAQYRLGLMLKTGNDDVAPNIREAAFWFEMATKDYDTTGYFQFGRWHTGKTLNTVRENKNLNAYVELGLIYRARNGVEACPDKARDCFLHAQQGGMGRASYELGNLYAHDYKDYTRAIECFTTAVNNFHPAAYCALGKIYALGYGPDPGVDYMALAVSNFEKAHELGIVDAGYELGKLHMLGHGVPQSLSKALDYFKEVRKDVKDAYVEIGKMLLYGYAVQQIVEDEGNGECTVGTRWSDEKSAEIICSKTFSGFYRQPLNGYGAQKRTDLHYKLAFDSFVKALPLNCYSSSCTEKESDAGPYLYMMYFGDIVDYRLPFHSSDVSEAMHGKFPELRMTDDDQPNYVELFKSMEGYPEAIRYYQNVADKKPPAEVKQRDRYANEFGIDYSYDFRFYSNAVQTNKNDANAWYRLGLLYAEGRGVAQNKDECLKCLRQAKELGHQDARKKFEELTKPDWTDMVIYEAKDFVKKLLKSPDDKQKDNQTFDKLTDQHL